MRSRRARRANPASSQGPGRPVEGRGAVGAGTARGPFDDAGPPPLRAPFDANLRPLRAGREGVVQVQGEPRGLALSLTSSALHGTPLFEGTDDGPTLRPPPAGFVRP